MTDSLHMPGKDFKREKAAAFYTLHAQMRHLMQLGQFLCLVSPHTILGRRYQFMQTPIFVYYFPVLKWLKFAKLLAVNLINHTTLLSSWETNPGILHSIDTYKHEIHGHCLYTNFTATHCSKPASNE